MNPPKEVTLYVCKSPCRKEVKRQFGRCYGWSIFKLCFYESKAKNIKIKPLKYRLVEE